MAKLPEDGRFPSENDSTPIKTEMKVDLPSDGSIDIGRIRRMGQVEASNGHVQNMSFDSKLNQPATTNLTKAEQEKFNHDRHFVETGKWPEEKQKYSATTIKDARLDPRMENIVMPIGEELTDEKATELLNELNFSKPKAEEKPKKNISELDRQFARAQDFFRKKSSKS